ncbi:hypothetical protein NGUA15_04189 [Salmonella enterica]|nr:hypothetical protein NGUA15_04189 [Salmonella enterica]
MLVLPAVLRVVLHKQRSLRQQIFLVEFCRRVIHQRKGVASHQRTDIPGTVNPAARAALRFHTNARQHFAFALVEIIARPFVVFVTGMAGFTRVCHCVRQPRARFFKVKIIQYPLPGTQTFIGYNGVDKCFIQL